jgi:DNA-binding transcriptional LysR family regulator
VSQWMGIELRHLAALRAIVEEGSFNRAALRLGYTQSAVSQQIGALERIVGHRLLNRQIGSNKVSLTPAGERFLAHADRLLDGLLTAEADLADLRRGGGERLAVGTYQSVGVRVLPEVLRRFSATWPGVDVQLVESWSDDELLAQLRRGDLSLTFATAPVAGRAFEWVEVLTDPVVLLARADSPLAGKAAVRPRDLAEVPLIGYHQCKSLAVLIDEFFKRDGLKPRFVHVADENGLIQALVRSGVGAAVVPRMAVDERDEEIRAVELALPKVARSIVLAWHRDRGRSLAATSFVEMAQKACARVEAELVEEARQVAH